MAKKLSAQEKKWRAESDAEIISRYNEIVGDRSRLKAAQDHARKQVEMLSRVANAGSTSPAVPARKTSKK